MSNKRYKSGGVESLLLKHAECVGEIVAVNLRLAVYAPPWWRWTHSLAIAMSLQTAIMNILPWRDPDTGWKVT